MAVGIPHDWFSNSLSLKLTIEGTLPHVFNCPTDMWPGQTKVQSTPDISNLALSGVRVIGSSKKIARSKVKEVFTVQWTFLSNVIVEMLSESWNIHLDYKSVRNVTKHSPNRERSKAVSRYIRDKQHQPPLVNYTSSVGLQNPIFRDPVHFFFPTF